jgi:exopolysaccharide biosynthesis polyprenyl glycosylphosphotransferase
VLGLLENPLSGWKLVVKASEDRMLAAALLVVFLPAILVIALLIKIDSPGPVLFRQRRIGFNNIPFYVMKFRTMHHRPAEDSLGLRQAQRADPRITNIGRFLRKSSLDEIPQLINVLKGNMSLVGPRPHPLWQNASDLSWKELGDAPLNAVVAEYMARHRVKPGITGWAQVRGYRGQTETIAMMQMRIEHDLYYIEQWSLWFDLKILFLTIFAVMRQENAH